MSTANLHFSLNVLREFGLKVETYQFTFNFTEATSLYGKIDN